MYSLNTYYSQLEFRIWDTRCNRFTGPFESLFLSNPEYIVTQFTGVFDKNNKKIFQGDIVSDRHYDNWMDNTGYPFLGFVYFASHLGSFRMQHVSNWNNYKRLRFYNGLALEPLHMIVVGNVFENADILKYETTP